MSMSHSSISMAVWTPLHDRLLHYMQRKSWYEDCKEIMRVLSKFASTGYYNSLDAFNDKESNLLFESFRARNLPFMKMLLEAGADPYTVNIDGNGWTLLHFMAASTCRSEEIEEFPNLQVTRHLLELYEMSLDGIRMGNFVNAPDNSGITALMEAAKAGNYSIAKWLLSNGANVNAKSTGGKTKGWTAAHMAAKKGHKDVLRLLLQNGADPNIKTSYVPRVKVRDVADGNKDIIELLDSFSLQKK